MLLIAVFPDYLLEFIKAYFCVLVFLFTGHLYGVGLIVPDGGCDAKTFNLVCNSVWCVFLNFNSTDGSAVDTSDFFTFF